MAWKTRLTFVDIANRAAARNCWMSGQSLTEISKSAKVSKSTIRRWIRDTGYHLPITERRKERG